MRLVKGFFKSELPRIIVGMLLFLPALLLDKLWGYEIAAIILYSVTLLVAGLPVFIDAVKGIIRLDFLDEKFLMSIAAIGAMIIGEYTEGVAVMLFFLVGEYFEHKATQKARSSIKSLVEICPDTARVIEDGEECEIDAEDVEEGSAISIRPGERVPIDAVIISGYADVDSSALTGESVPRSVSVGDTVDSGEIILGGLLTARTLRLAENSRAARVLSLVEEASDRKSKEENFITVFSRYYTPIVIILAIAMAVIPIVFSILDWRDAIHRALSFLVISCPCALVISVPMAFFGGIGAAASRGVLFKGGNVFGAVSRTRSVVFDKTGTVTSGRFHITEISPKGIDGEYLLKLAASVEYSSNHPIAKGISEATSDRFPAQDIREIAGCGVMASVDGKTVAVGNARLMERVGANINDEHMPLGSVLVAIDGEYRGYICLSDTVKPEAADAIKALRRLGTARTYILSGDKREGVSRVAKEIGIDEAYGEMMPEEKYERLEEIIQNTSGSTVYVGDGINDAPSLARADVGIAMGDGGSDSAIEVADVVIMSDNLERIPEAIKIARRTVSIAKQNIVFAICVKLIVMLLVSLNLANMWWAVFADVGVAVIAILNSMRTLTKKK